MGELNYTKGNWKVTKPFNQYIVAEQEHQNVDIARITTLKKEDGQLISSAPDMYEALKSFIDATEQAKDVKFSMSMNVAFGKLRKALNKAESKQ